MGWLKPVPRDDTTTSVESDDDAVHIVPTRTQRYPEPGDRALLAGYYPSYATLDGPRWRVGRMFYPGVSQPTTGEPMGARDINMVPMRPPQITNKGGTAASMRDAFAFARLQMNYPGMPMIIPEVVRR